MFSQQIAVNLETAARRALNIKGRGGMAGVISVDYIEKQQGAFAVLTASLAPYYLNATKEEREPLDEMLEKYMFLQDCSPEEYYKGVSSAAEELKALLERLGVQRPE